MTQVSDKPAERPRGRDPREEREPGGAGGVPAELTRLFAQCWAADDEGSGAQASLFGTRASGDVVMIEALAEQLAPRLQAAPQWPLKAVLYLPRLGRINASVRREQGAWSIDLEAEEAATARWLSGVRQQCEDRFAATLGQPVSLHLPTVGCA
ncbi:type III secretion system HrpP C-terminal domain-containing protein [Pseudomonas sp. MAFF 311095]|uniref:Type III secretion system HrpP C-terminal domain-containing protein n=1 Tax=Pseudomonas petroselini TaxID=2899822 RepID=A0ABS8QNE7_9PSED|nr:type III secretion system HrpP C-terminal domain-containing protein [Pseudomonas petroselini]MCD7036953.1 type III secretion system HrpP C-terminal domain-containing protein [Pseudomonas petroselini]MCD7044346.1 type III secretion system HrpP C-terminal domain-containing protein [Pseudomonas petroselini]MCD7066887.1 type III secretion system HrpP C-terminal domain-containing protein [Pseudomonas petroselini]MCD7078529.1 type III secretion system HrpP C-terminal domain-containing protein [Pse